MGLGSHTSGSEITGGHGAAQHTRKIVEKPFENDPGIGHEPLEKRGGLTTESIRPVATADDRSVPCREDEQVERIRLWVPESLGHFVERDPLRREDLLDLQQGQERTSR